MNIVFNINQLGLEGLGATLTSLIRSCSNSKELVLWFLCSGLIDKDKENILRLLKEESFCGDTKFVDFDAEQMFGKLKSLHGDWTTYGRLLIPDIIESEYAIYLDSDLIIHNIDILELKGFTSDKILSAVFGTSVQWALENEFFINRLKWAPGTEYFNAGVLIFNLSKWKEENIDKKIKSILVKYPEELISHDQTLLNAVCEGNFTHLPRSFNLPWYPGKQQPENIDRSIIHFVGSPKPWDMFGKIIHGGHNTWKTYNPTFWERKYGKLTLKKIRRAWKIRRSLFVNFKSKMGSG